LPLSGLGAVDVGGLVVVLPLLGVLPVEVEGADPVVSGEASSSVLASSFFSGFTSGSLVAEVGVAVVSSAGSV
jgi:hypothetical protein